MAELNPYLTFSDNCEEAFNFYKSVFGGEFLTLMRFSGNPVEYQSTEDEAQRIMHIALPIGKKSVLMGSDTPGNMGAPIMGNNFTLSVQPETFEEAKRLFDGLSAGGLVTMPFEKTFWAEGFGMFTDKYRMNWLVNYEGNANQ